MARSVEEEGSNGGGSGNQERRRPSVAAHAPPAELARRPAAYAHARAYDHAVTYAHLRAYVSLAVKASGLLTLFLSMVILLGGYLPSLETRDFFCVMAITVIQATGIFQDWKTNLRYIVDFAIIFLRAMGILNAHIPALVAAALAFGILILCILLLYTLGPLVCAGISSWRIAKLNHGNPDRDANMVAALNIFYSLVIFNGTMFLVLLFPMSFYYRRAVARSLLALEQLSDKKWGKEAIRRYIYDISKKCRKDPVSIKGRDLIKYGAELLDSQSQEDYLYGVRLLGAFVNKGEDVSWVLLSSRNRIQRLIDSLMISSSSSSSSSGKCYAVIGSSVDDKKEIRELAAMIVADVAAGIDELSNYPGAMRCISSLLQQQEEATQAYLNWNNKQVPDDPPLHQRPIGPLTKREHNQEKRMQRLIRLDEHRHMNLMKDQNRMEIRDSQKKRMEIREHRHRNQREEGTSNKLVQLGLTILEKLASNSDNNRRLICGAPGLLTKITAPVYSATLIEDVKTKAWANIVTRILRVLYQLICGPDGNLVLYHGIFSNNTQSLSNLRNILALGNNEAYHQELQLVTMKILTELALDPSINLTEETKMVLVTKQLQLFLFANGDDEEESAAIAGRAMVSLSTNCEGNSVLIMTTENAIGCLVQILGHENITRRTIAAEIMANLCAHCNVHNMKELLPEVLRKIMSVKTNSQQRRISAGQNYPAALGDEENQGNPLSTNNEERHNISTRGKHTETKKTSDQEREEQEAFLSLAQVICDKLNSTYLDGAIQIAVQNENNAGSEERRREAFVDKLKAIIDGNCHPTADCLRVVKLCGQIAKSVMRCEQYVEIFRNKGFKSSLSEASKTMAELESCILFVGTDFGLKKTVRPLFSEIEKTWSQM